MSQKRTILNNRYSFVNEDCILNQLPNDVLNIIRDYWLHDEMLLIELGLNHRIHYNRTELYRKLRLFKILTNTTYWKYNFDGKLQKCVDMNWQQVHYRSVIYDNPNSLTPTFEVFDYNMVDEKATDMSKKYLFFIQTNKSKEDIHKMCSLSK